uniref:Uncharacterized protein n=1 Tax=Anguilla anguilla TaxID=7936 RepID=A0A0E9PCN7_ANGAN
MTKIQKGSGSQMASALLSCHINMFGSEMWSLPLFIADMHVIFLIKGGVVKVYWTFHLNECMCMHLNDTLLSTCLHRRFKKMILYLHSCVMNFALTSHSMYVR